jgi:hypothetical protein
LQSPAVERKPRDVSGHGFGTHANALGDDVRAIEVAVLLGTGSQHFGGALTPVVVSFCHFRFSKKAIRKVAVVFSSAEKKPSRQAYPDATANPVPTTE